MGDCKGCTLPLLEAGERCATCRGDSPLGAWCVSCAGQGWESSGCDGAVECGRCEGSCRAAGKRGTCTACRGTGRTALMNSRLCPACRGLGNTPGA